MATTYQQTEQKRLIKQFHTLLSKLRIGTEGKADILRAYGASSSLDLCTGELEEICGKLHELANGNSLDKLRKQAMAAIGGWLRLIGHEQNAEKIKAIACRATEHKYFNAIPEERLRNVYHLFVKKQKDFRAVNRVTAEELDRMSMMN